MTSPSCPRPSDDEVKQVLDKIWTALIHTDRPVFREVRVAAGIVGHQLRWEDLVFKSSGPWSFCPQCQQWSAYNVLGVCPSFRCTGRLEVADPGDRLAENHYRRTYMRDDEAPIPLVAREHTAQLAPRLATAYQIAFQEGHHPDEGQINVLSSSTTFELGVDLGDLEAVLLRNVPPSPANYQQRAGRAGRGIGSAAFAVTFAMPRSHDEHFFAQPPLMIDGLVRPPHIDLRNETIYHRHIHAVLLAEFARDWSERTGMKLTTIGQLLGRGSTASVEQSSTIPLDDFLGHLAEAVARNARTVGELVPGGYGAIDPVRLAERIRAEFDKARNYFANEVRMYDEVIKDVWERYEQARKEHKWEVCESPAQLYRDTSGPGGPSPRGRLGHLL